MGLSLLLALTTVVSLRSEFHGTHEHILLSQIRDSPNLKDKVPIFITPRNRMAQFNAQALSSIFVSSYDSQSYGGDIRTPSLKSESKLCYDRRSVAQSLLE
jgi:hypothetical protein